MEIIPTFVTVLTVPRNLQKSNKIYNYLILGKFSVPASTWQRRRYPVYRHRRSTDRHS
ncbi:MAG: hypothetical protein SWX82_19305 [Cyanobacteriota bacterium]|nr:hypothetical protein [Cyanobacteriota bacterium]